jgi:hypothetical protein
MGNAISTDSALQPLGDRIAIQDIICAVTLQSDLNEPEKALAQYTEDAVISYSSVMGLESSRVPVKLRRERLQRALMYASIKSRISK